MTSKVGTGPSYRVLLIGIDAYPESPLHGAVNDIDAIQRILLDGLGVPAERIRRLASPDPAARREAALPEQPATLANIRAAFTELAEETGAGDRVFIYYSGHGMRTKLVHGSERTTDRESIVAVDVGPEPGSGLLYDYELNELLGAITARTRSLTVILDCCHSAGVTRGDPDGARYLDPVRYLRWPDKLPAPAGCPGLTGAARPDDTSRNDGLVRTVEDCHVVAACQGHELAYERTGEGSTRHGRLTRAFVRALETVDRAELPTVPWLRIWQAMRDEVEGQRPQQHLWMSDNPARAVFAGPPVNADPGIPIRRVGGTYELAAGSLASITEGAVINVYGEQPPQLPPLDSEQDMRVRHGQVRVTRADETHAWGVAVRAPFELPPGARGRLAAPGSMKRLRCALATPDERIAAALRASPLLEVVEQRAPVSLERVGDRWFVTDDFHGPEPDKALVHFPDRDPACARRVLEHYFHYSQPLRLVETIGRGETLKLRVLVCAGSFTSRAAQDPDLPEAGSRGTGTYEVRVGATVCFRVHNAGHRRLRVTLLNSAASGKVQHLGTQTIDAKSSHVFWAGGILGQPFIMTVPDGRVRGIDRLTAVGSTLMNVDFSHLQTGSQFEDALATPRGAAVYRSARIIDHQWAATQAIVVTHVGSGGR